MEKLVFITEDDEGRDTFIPFNYSSLEDFKRDLNATIKIQREEAIETNKMLDRNINFKIAKGLELPNQTNSVLYLSLWDDSWSVLLLEEWFSTYQKTLDINER